MILEDLQMNIENKKNKFKIMLEEEKNVLKKFQK